MNQNRNSSYKVYNNNNNMPNYVNNPKPNNEWNENQIKPRKLQFTDQTFHKASFSNSKVD